MAYGVESDAVFGKLPLVQGRDIMGAGQAPDKNPLDVTSLSSYFNHIDQNQSPSFRQMVHGNMPQQTLLNKIVPQNSYNVDVKTSTMARKASGHVSDSVNVAQMRRQAEKDVQHEKGRLVGDIKDIKRQADSAQAEAAQDVGVDPSAAAVTFGASEPPTKIAAAVTVGIDLAVGGGTMVTGLMQGGTVVAELSKKDKMLSSQEQQSVLDNELQRLQPNGDHVQASIKFDVPKKNPVAWENADTGDLRAIHSLSMDKLEEGVPELKRLNNIEHDISEVRDSHRHMQNRDDISFDAGSVEIASQGLQGISRLKTSLGTNGAFSSVETAPVSLKESVLARESGYNMSVGLSMGMS